MGFRNGAYCTVWGVTKQNRYCNVELSTSKKNKETNEYETDFSSKFVMFCGNEALPFAEKLKRGDRIKLLSTDVKTSSKDNKWYTSFFVYQAEMAEDAQRSTASNTANIANAVDHNQVEGSSPWG